MLFRRVELREARPQNPRLPVLTARRHLFLLHAVFDHPYLGPTAVWRVAKNDDLQKGLIGSYFNLVMELRDKRPQLFEKCHANAFEIRLCFTALLISQIRGRNVLDIPVQANRLGIGGELPLGGAEKDTNVPHIEIHHARRNSLRFDGLIDRRENDGFASYMNDDPATRQIGNDFVFARGFLGTQFGSRKCCAHEGGASQ